ncbi:hypothetical protein CDAR_126891 [Caerostris darwini]|uniref:Uncharacterized protein n=1 Tax=Caerostris darwini TaxID=1538125 RepID=A0AAV4T4T1_9ARAC|nr:hypothetical protein CDAR_126891 [Caerostris darwini]
MTSGSGDLPPGIRPSPGILWAGIKTPNLCPARDSPITWDFIGGNKDAESLSRKVISLERPLMDLSTETRSIQELCLGIAPGVLGELS